MRFLTALIFTFLVTPAFARTTILSSTFVFIASGTGVTCNFVNVSTKPLDVTVSVVDIANTVLTTNLFTAVSPQQGNGLGTGVGGSAGETARCVFAFSGSSKSLRGALEVVNLAGVLLATLPAT
jgi:hypothetical protein